MLSLIAFILAIVGSINWFCIGLLQFDFVAGLFGSQSSIFSRIIYVAVGLSAFILLFNLIKNKGKITFDFKSKKEATTLSHKPALSKAEADREFHEPSYKPNDFNGHKDFEHEDKTNMETRIKPYDLSEESGNSYKPKENTEEKEDNHSM